MRLTDIETRAAAELGVPLILAHADTPAETLSVAERRHLEALRFEARRRDWLIGRNALKQVLRRRGDSDDCANVRPADAGVSLTHGDGHAFAVGAATPGIGIDFERPRRVHPRMASWFLDDEEQAMLPRTHDAAFDRELVRLWTVKEAAFKSHPDNAGLTLADLRINTSKGGSPPFSKNIGLTAFSCSVRGVRIDVVSTEHRGGFLSIAGVR